MRVDGEMVCTETPCTASIPSGVRRVQFDRAEYLPEQKNIEISKTADPQINVELSPRKGRNILALHGLNRDLESSDFSLAPAVKARSRPDPKRGRPLLEKYLASVPEPTRSVAAYFEGRVLTSEGKHAEAVKKFRLARQLDRKHREPFERLLESLRASGQTAEAERLFKEADEATENKEN